MKDVPATLSAPQRSRGVALKVAQAPRGAIVMGGDYRGLALVRSLGRQQVPVWVIDQADQRLAGMSKYARRTLFYRDWEDGGGAAFLLELGRKHSLKGWLLFPTSDESVRLSAEHHEQLSEIYEMTVLPWEILRWAVDKGLMNQLSDQIGVDHPKTYYPFCAEELPSLELPFPVILKPTRRDNFNQLTAAKAWRADDIETLVAQYHKACQLLPPEMLMIQEFIPGGGETQFSYAGLWKDGQPVAFLVARRNRQFPVDFGRASTFVETVNEPRVIEPAVRFLKAIQYSGLVEVEFKQDSRTAKFNLLDINPRVWGWYSLCRRAGVDFAHILWQIYQDVPINEIHARTGERWVRLLPDFLASLREIQLGRLSVREYVRSLSGPKESAVFAADDPLPGLLEAPLLFYLFSKRLFRGKGI
jgi:D-aspartate ligase